MLIQRDYDGISESCWMLEVLSELVQDVQQLIGY